MSEPTTGEPAWACPLAARPGHAVGASCALCGARAPREADRGRPDSGALDRDAERVGVWGGALLCGTCTRAERSGGR